MILSEFGAEFGDILLGKVQWMILGAVSSFVSISTMESNQILFSIGEYGISTGGITFCLSTGLVILSMVKIFLGCIEGALSIKQKRRDLEND